jgi:Domain of unknown function (DUF4332)
MHLIYRIISAGFAQGTQHKLALDALRQLQGAEREHWQRLFLSYAELYLEGAQAPDQEFKDFKNHVLHTREDYWGGAPQKVVSWYQHLVEGLSQQDWQTAVYCAGVLSHYYTDPLHPFHTGQSEAANNIHRAVEWSIAKSYDQLRAQGEREFPQMPVEVTADANWLASLVLRGAHRANASYEKLIAHYDLERGVVDPPAGLDRIARRIIVELIRYASVSYAIVLGRALEEARVRPPVVPLMGATLLAGLKVPFKLVQRRRADRAERRAIERSYDELIAVGMVEATLRDEERVVRDLHATEVLAKRRPPEASQVYAFRPRPRIVTHIERTRAARLAVAAHDNVVAFEALRPPPLKAVTDGSDHWGRARAGLTLRLQGVVAAAPRRRVSSTSAAPGRLSLDQPGRLSLDQDVVLAPSIGAKTAARLYLHGIKTVRDLIKADPTALAVLIGARHITAEIISSWQDQARLSCTLPGLAGAHAQLLLGAGYANAQAIAAAEPDRLCADVINFALTATGQRLLRQAEMPDLEKVKAWHKAARGIEAA